MPTYLNKMREKARGKGRDKIRTHEDEKNCQVGFTDGEDIYVIDVKTIREYYNTINYGKQSPSRDARLYAKEIASILPNEKSYKKWN
jgi:hypothetical protein